MFITIFDSETTGLCLKNSFMNEVGWAVYEVDFLNGWTLISSQSYLVNWGAEYVHSIEAERITGITENMVREHGLTPEFVFTELFGAFKNSEVFGGQNTHDYDTALLMNQLARLTNPVVGEMIRREIARMTQIDTLWDLPFPKGLTSRQLDYLAFKHGYIMSGAHRAINDVFAAAHIFSQYPIEKIIESASTPVNTYIEKVEYKDEKRKDKLYAEGFRWNKEKRLYELRTRQINESAIRQRLGET